MRVLGSKVQRSGFRVASYALRGADFARPSVRTRPRPRRRCTSFDFEDEDEDDDEDDSYKTELLNIKHNIRHLSSVVCFLKPDTCLPRRSLPERRRDT